MRTTDRHHDHRPQQGTAPQGRPGSGRRRGTRGSARTARARRALRREAPRTVALLAGPADFHAMRCYATFAFDNHARYLRQVHGLLRHLTARGNHVSVVRFDPVQYAAYCAASGRDPDRPGTRTRYVADVAACGASIAYDGQPVEQLLAQLAAAVDRHTTWERAADALTRTAGTEAAYDRAALAFTRLLESVGSGTHHLVCSVPLGDSSLVAAVHAECHPDGTARLAEADALVLTTLLAAGIATGSPGGLVLRTGTGRDSQPDRVRGWCLREGWLHPLTEAQVFDAYCTDPRTGEPVPPEPGVTYCPGTAIPPPWT